MKKLPVIKTISDLKASIKTTQGQIGTIQDRIHHEAIAATIEFFRPKSKGNTNWIKEHISAYVTYAGSVRLQALIGWYEEYTGVIVKQNDDYTIETVVKDKNFKPERGIEQLNKCKAFPFYKWGLQNLEKPLKTPEFPESAASMLAKGIATGTFTPEEAQDWIKQLQSKVDAKLKDDKIIDFADKYAKQHPDGEDGDDAFMQQVEVKEA